MIKALDDLFYEGRPKCLCICGAANIFLSHPSLSRLATDQTNRQTTDQKASIALKSLAMKDFFFEHLCSFFQGDFSFSVVPNEICQSFLPTEQFLSWHKFVAGISLSALFTLLSNIGGGGGDF